MTTDTAGIRPSELLVWPLTPPGRLRFIPRAEFRAFHFPQALCTAPTPCKYRGFCDALLAPDAVYADAEAWMVRDGNVCGRRHHATPLDVRREQQRALAALVDDIDALTEARDERGTPAERPWWAGV